jgi:O-antigen/teichoic acid export membrane protein
MIKNSIREMPLITAQYISLFLTKGHPRSLMAKKNIIASFLIKATSIAISLILVPLTINYISAEQYGIWLTLSSIVVWLSFFDIGFGNGLRNKFAAALAEKKIELARIYVSTTYAILSIIIGIVLIIFFIINSYINWSKILNSPPEMDPELSILALIVFVFFCLRFVFQLISTVLIANQESAKATSLDLLASIVSLFFIFILTKNTAGNLIYLGITLSITPVIILFLSSILLYRFEYKRFAPSFKHIKFNYAKDLMSLGIKFFIIQIGALVLFNTDNIIIIHLLGPKEVTTFNVTFKLFSIITMIFNIIATPLWSAYTDAYAKNDFDWIRSTISSMKKIWLMLIMLTILILISSPIIFKLWLGDSIQIPFVLSIAMASYVIVAIWQTIHVFLLNGIGKIKLQLYLVVFSSLVNIPMAFFLGRVIGLVGIILTSTILFAVMGIVFSIQTQKILNNKATKLWNQ